MFGDLADFVRDDRVQKAFATLYETANKKGEVLTGRADFLTKLSSLVDNGRDIMGHPMLFTDDYMLRCAFQAMSDAEKRANGDMDGMARRDLIDAAQLSLLEEIQTAVEFGIGHGGHRRRGGKKASKPDEVEIVPVGRLLDAGEIQALGGGIVLVQAMALFEPLDASIAPVQAAVQAAVQEASPPTKPRKSKKASSGLDESIVPVQAAVQEASPPKKPRKSKKASSGQDESIVPVQADVQEEVVSPAKKKTKTEKASSRAAAMVDPEVYTPLAQEKAAQELLEELVAHRIRAVARKVYREAKEAKKAEDEVIVLDD